MVINDSEKDAFRKRLQTPLSDEEISEGMAWITGIVSAHKGRPQIYDPHRDVWVDAYPKRGIRGFLQRFGL